MKKFVFIFLFLPVFVFSQEHIILKNSILDSIAVIPVEDANIYNFDIKSYVFTFKGIDFLIIDKTKGENEHKLPDTYAEFKRRFLNTNFSQINKLYGDISLTKQDIINAGVSSGNLMAYEINKYVKLQYNSNMPRSTGVGVVVSPISYLYDKYSRKAKMARLYQELMDKEDEVINLTQKYNQKIVNLLTGLEGDELLDFMTFCKFSYYDLIRWTPEYIILQIKDRFGDYEFYKALEDN